MDEQSWFLTGTNFKLLFKKLILVFSNSNPNLKPIISNKAAT
jgi:hypothetical protein